jgi:cephalosporin-C deacetylase
MTRFMSRLAFAIALVVASLSSLSAQRAPIAQQLAFVPYHANGLYGVGETVGWTVTAGPTPPIYPYRWTIRRNNAVVLKEGKLDLSKGKDTIEIVGDQPGMIYVAVEAYADPTPAGAGGQAAEPPRFEGGNTGRDTGFYAVGAAVAPTKIGLSTPRPADFDAFWDGKLAAQAKAPLNAVLTPVETDVPGVEMSIFQLDALGSRAHGYVAKPAREGKFPAVIQLQYAGVYALNAGAVARRAAEGWLIVNVDSHDKLPSDPSGDVPRSYQAVGNTGRETSYFLNMYLRDSRVLDYVMTRPDWDGTTIVLMGGSMGGQQSLSLAGLRPDKISAVLVCVPAGADTNADLHGRKAGYPNWPSDKPDVMRTALYFDPVNFAPRIKAPVMAGMGFIDTISPPAGVWTVLNHIPGAVEPLPLIEAEHDNLTPEKVRACPARTSEILDLIVHGGRYVPHTLGSVSSAPVKQATRASAVEALRVRESDPERIAHALAVEATMRGMARRVGGNADEWGLAGLLHDIDLAQTRDDPTRHGVVGARLIAELGFGAAVAQAVAAHDDNAGVPRRTPMEHALYCADRAFWAIRASGVRVGKGGKPPAAAAVVRGLAEKGITDRIDRKLDEACAALGLTVEELLALSLSETARVERAPARFP